MSKIAYICETISECIECQKKYYDLGYSFPFIHEIWEPAVNLVCPWVMYVDDEDKNNLAWDWYDNVKDDGYNFKKFGGREKKLKKIINEE